MRTTRIPGQERRGRPQAAEGGSDRIVFFKQEISEKVAERLSIETKLRRALDNREFVIHYQPKVDLESRRIEGAEALIRWQSPDFGLSAAGEIHRAA